MYALYVGPQEKKIYIFTYLATSMEGGLAWAFPRRLGE